MAQKDMSPGEVKTTLKSLDVSPGKNQASSPILNGHSGGGESMKTSGVPGYGGGKKKKKA